MIKYLTRKFAYSFLVMFGVVVIVFFLFQGLGDPSRLILGQTGDAATLQNIRKELYLDQPVWKQFLLYLRDISPVSVHSRNEIEQKKLRGIFLGRKQCLALKFPYLRRSYQSRREVGGILMEALPGTLILATAAMLVAIFLGIPGGVLAAVRQNKKADHLVLFSSVLGISAPSFFTGILVAYIFGFLLNRQTGLSMTGSLYDVDPFHGKHLQLRNLVLPALTLGIRPLAIITQLTRGAMLDVLHQDYIRTAYAKGLGKRVIIWKHALRNALNPVITAVTGWFAELLAGAFFIEYIFGWKGIGKVTVDALEKLDYPVVMGSVLLTAALFVLVNILADLLYAWVDPRIRIH